MRLFKRVFWSDTHAPNHDARAVKIALEIVKDFKPDEFVFLGDYQDMYCVSQYTKSPEANFNLLSEELKSGKELIREIEAAALAKSYVYLSGNHENRVDRYIATYGPKLGGLYSTREILGLPKHYKYYPYSQKGHYRCGDWVITHGSLCNKHVAASMLAKYGCNILFGHTHRIQEYWTANFHGDQIRAITCGWLGNKEKAAEYITNVADWSHGFAIGYFKPNGKGFIQIIPIINYEAIFNGVIYR